MQWNARSAVSNKHSLIKFLNEMNIDIALINETWFKPGTIINFQGFNMIRKDRYDGKAGVAILIKKNLNSKEIHLINNFNGEICVCGADIFINKTKYSFLSIYRPLTLTQTQATGNIFLIKLHLPA